MAPKKSNAFMEFVMTKKSVTQSVPEAVKEFGPVWAGMTPQQKGPFESMAKKSNFAPKEQRKLTTIGVSVAQVQNLLEEKKNNQKHMKETILEIVDNGIESKTLLDHKFYFIHIQYFCKSIKEDFYIPCEIGLVEFTLRKGITKTFHNYINPRILPLGTRYEAEQRKSEHHQLELPPNALGKSDFELLWNDILDFTDHCFPPLFTATASKQQVVNVLDQFREVAESNDYFQVFEVQPLFAKLKEESSNSFFHCNLADRIIQTDRLQYRFNIGCKLHDDLDASKACSLSIAKRWTFYLFDLVCGEWEISMIPGAHMPDDNVEIKLPESKSLDNTKEPEKENTPNKQNVNNSDDSDKKPWRRSSRFSNTAQASKELFEVSTAMNKLGFK